MILSWLIQDSFEKQRKSVLTFMAANSTLQDSIYTSSYTRPPAHGEYQCCPSSHLLSTEVIMHHNNISTNILHITLPVLHTDTDSHSTDTDRCHDDAQHSTAQHREGGMGWWRKFLLRLSTFFLPQKSIEIRIQSPKNPVNLGPTVWWGSNKEQ